MKSKITLIFIALFAFALCAPRHAKAEVLKAAGPMLLIYMDNEQTDHLRAYGVAYWCLQPEHGFKAQWLLNYRGGSFLVDDSQLIRDRATLVGVSYKVLPPETVNRIYDEIQNINAEVVLLEKAPKIAVYVPPSNEPWDDAVRMSLEYAKIPYDTVWDSEVIGGKLKDYDWLHLHHEDFTGQYGKFYANFRNADWYIKTVQDANEIAKKIGFDSVQKMKGSVALAIRAYVENGGFLFAMCSAPDSFDIALSAVGIDIVPQEIDGTPITPDAQNKLNFDRTFAFKDFKIITDAYVYEVSDIDVTPPNINDPRLVPDVELFEFSAKQDPALSIFVQNHAPLFHDFLGQTTAFRRSLLKDDVVVLAETPGTDRVKYIHGNVGKGSYTFLGGHDPEDFAHLVGEKPTEISHFIHSPGYRLILNNVLFPSMRKKEKKT
ncbi:MAG: asparagine synthetase B [bacterium]